MAQQYNIDASLFLQTKDILSILTLPHIFDYIKNVDELTAKDILDLYLKFDAIATRRVLNDMLKKAYTEGDNEKVIQLRQLKKDAEGI